MMPDYWRLAALSSRSALALSESFSVSVRRHVDAKKRMLWFLGEVFASDVRPKENIRFI